MSRAFRLACDCHPDHPHHPTGMANMDVLAMLNDMFCGSIKSPYSGAQLCQVARTER